jgi:hypothetical protein
MKELKFNNYVFNNDGGWNYTVRLTDKWYTNSKPGDQVLLVDNKDTDQKHHEIGIIRELTRCTFYGIPSRCFKEEHDPECRNIDGLYKAMKEAYGEEFNPSKELKNDQVVTCIAFTIK